MGRLTLYISTVTASQKGGEDITFHCHSTIAAEQACSTTCGRCHGSKYCAAVADRSLGAAMLRKLGSLRPGSHTKREKHCFHGGKESACGFSSVHRFYPFGGQCACWGRSARLTGNMRGAQKERIFFPGTPQLPSQGTADILKLRQAELAILRVSRMGGYHLWSVIAP